MELLQQVVTNSYPSATNLLKFWATQLIDLTINLLTAYPINVALLVLIIILIVYKCLNKLFGDKMFRAKYKPLEHKQNLVSDVKLLKKQIREMQTDIIDIRKKFNAKKENDGGEQDQNPQQNISQNYNSNQAPTNSIAASKLQSEIRQKIHMGQESIKFNEALQRSLKQSNEQIIKTLRQINEKN